MINVAIAIVMCLGLIGGQRAQALAVARGWVTLPSSRKFAHVFLGPVILFSWLLYREDPGARWLAALAPLALAVHFVLLGTGVIEDRHAVTAATRSGQRREFLRGPLYYVVSFSLLTVLFWRNSPAGIAALAIMVFGDGFAEIVGRAIPSPRLFWSRKKSVAGMLAVLLVGWIAAAASLWVFAARDHLAGPWEGYLAPLVVVALAGAVIESLPYREADNLTVPLACAAVGYLLF